MICSKRQWALLTEYGRSRLGVSHPPRGQIHLPTVFKRQVFIVAPLGLYRASCNFRYLVQEYSYCYLKYFCNFFAKPNDVFFLIQSEPLQNYSLLCINNRKHQDIIPHLVGAHSSRFP